MYYSIGSRESGSRRAIPLCTVIRISLEQNLVRDFVVIFQGNAEPVGHKALKADGVRPQTKWTIGNLNLRHTLCGHKLFLISFPAQFDSSLFALLPLPQDELVAAEVDISWCQVAQ